MLPLDWSASYFGLVQRKLSLDWSVSPSGGIFTTITLECTRTNPKKAYFGPELVGSSSGPVRLGCFRRSTTAVSRCQGDRSTTAVCRGDRSTTAVCHEHQSTTTPAPAASRRPRYRGSAHASSIAAHAGRAVHTQAALLKPSRTHWLWRAGKRCVNPVRS